MISQHDLDLAVARARLETLESLETVVDEDGVLAEFGSIAHLRHKNRMMFAARAAVEKLERES